MSDLSNGRMFKCCNGPFRVGNRRVPYQLELIILIVLDRISKETATYNQLQKLYKIIVKEDW